MEVIGRYTNSKALPNTLQNGEIAVTAGELLPMWELHPKLMFSVGRLCVSRGKCWQGIER